MNVIDVVDTTVRDGEQTSGVSFKPEEKLIIVKHLLAEAGVTRCEVSSAKVSREEQNSLARIMDWAKSDGFADPIKKIAGRTLVRCDEDAGICPRQRLCGKCLSGGLVKRYLEFAGLCMANA